MEWRLPEGADLGGSEKRGDVERLEEVLEEVAHQG